MQRFENWRERLLAWREVAARTPFIWGQSDCCLTVADAVFYMTGRDFAAPWRGYADARGALRFIRDAGGMHALIDSTGLEPVAPTLAGVGDVVLLGFGRHPALGLCAGKGAIAQGAAGLEMVAMAHAAAGWRI